MARISLHVMLIGIITGMMVCACASSHITGTASHCISIVGRFVEPAFSQNYTTMVFSDPVVASLNQTAAKQLLQGITHDVIRGTGTQLDGAFAIPNAMPASLLATHDIVESLLALDGTVPNAASIANWLWSRYDQLSGSFTDEYCMNWSLQVSGSTWIASNRYSPLVATACAFDTLRLLRQPLDSAINTSVATYILSCYDAAVDAFTGSPSTTEPTLQDTYWAVKTLSTLGQLAQVNAGSCAAYINSLPDATGLYQLHNPVLILPAPEYLGGTICASRLAMETLSVLGRLGTINVATFRSTIMNFYDTTNHRFINDYSDANKTSLATAEALDILSLIGFPAGFTTTELPQVIEQYARAQLFTGGWPLDSTQLITPASHCARILTDLLAIVGRNGLGTMNLTSLRGVFAASLVGSEVTGIAGYAPFPEYNPSLDACRAVIDIASAGGVLDPAAINAAKVEVAGTTSAQPFPYQYPEGGTPAFLDANAYRTFTTSGAYYLEQGVALKILLGMPFSSVDLNQLLTEFKQLQLTSNTPCPGLQGLCIAASSLKPWIAVMGGLKERIASFETTLAAVKAINALRTYGNGSAFLVEKLLNLGMLYSRITSAYREGATIAWFERESPADFQAPAGADDAKLRDARTILEIINATRGFSAPAIVATLSLSKLANLALTEPRHTITDIDNALAILALLNRTISPQAMASIVCTLGSFRVNGTAWFSRLGLPNLFETVKAYRILARFSGIKITISHMVNTGNGNVQVMAGTTLTMRAELVNCFRGDEPSWSFTWGVQVAGIGGQGGAIAIPVVIPLNESVLGPANLTISMPAASLNTTMTIPFTIAGVLAIDPAGDPIVISTPKRAPSTVSLGLYIISPDNASRRAPARHGNIFATGLTINDTGYFEPFNGTAPGQYSTLLGVSQLSADTTYHLEASHKFCDLLQAMLVLHCDDNLSTMPTLVLPLCIAGMVLGIAIIKPRSIRRRAPRATGGRKNST
ncbi:MAG TPA: hypothetical protein VKM55_06335 [Candidatus Lokiarchaeia archaeon]|nr:hypothetical protein [Candidatus Lokiarchaeia archaeon]